MWHEILKDAEGFIGIDSSLQHMSASAKTEGVVIWGSTRFNQFGYSENTNVNFHMEDTWDETKFNGADPRNAMVDPAKVVQLYMEKTK
jgi:ADP-heptose:LPS heptosyltransferase